MTNRQIELAKWWTSLRIADKEMLAQKPYPQCSNWWINLSEQQQLDVKEKAGIARAPRNMCYGFT